MCILLEENIQSNMNTFACKIHNGNIFKDGIGCHTKRIGTTVDKHTPSKIWESILGNATRMSNLTQLPLHFQKTSSHLHHHPGRLMLHIADVLTRVPT